MGFDMGNDIGFLNCTFFAYSYILCYNYRNVYNYIFVGIGIVLYLFS